MADLADPGTSSAECLEAQKLLNKSLQQSRVAENGAFDGRMQQALREFQAQSGLSPTGRLDGRTMDLLRKAASIPNPDYQIVYKGRVYLLTKPDYDRLVQRTLEEFKPALRKMMMAVDEARFLWTEHKKLRSDQYIVGWMIESWSGARFPPEGTIKKAEAAYKAAKAAYDAKNLKTLPMLMHKGAQPINKARADVKKYVTQIQDGGASLVTTLEFVKTSSFIVCGVIAAPVAASYGAGAVAAGMIAGAGTSAVESLANEVGKGIAGDSKGIGDATLNVLRDAFIGGSIGALVKGKGAEKLLAKIGPAVAKRMGGELGKKVSEKALAKWVIGYFKANGANILEGICKDVMNSFKSTSKPLTVKSFVESVAKNVATAGIFSKFEKAAKVDAKSIVSQLSSSQKKQIMKGMGDKMGDKELIAVFAELMKNEREIGFNLALDKTFAALSGSEEPKQVEKLVIKNLLTPGVIKKAEALAKAKQKAN